MTYGEKAAIGAGAGAGRVAGFAAVPAILLAADGVDGLSAPGIRDALAAVGMVGGVVTVAGIPVGCIAAGAALAYCGCRLIRHWGKR